MCKGVRARKGPAPEGRACHVRSLMIDDALPYGGHDKRAPPNHRSEGPACRVRRPTIGPSMSASHGHDQNAPVGGHTPMTPTTQCALGILLIFTKKGMGQRPQFARPGHGQHAASKRRATCEAAGSSASCSARLLQREKQHAVRRQCAPHLRGTAVDFDVPILRDIAHKVVWGCEKRRAIQIVIGE